MLFSAWYYRKLELTELQGNDGKAMLDKKIICISYKSRDLEIFQVFLWFSKKSVNLLLFLCGWYLKTSGMNRIYWATTWNFRLQIWISKHIKIIAAIFDKISKQQVHLSLFLSDWYCQKLSLTTLLCQDGKSTSDMNLILSFHEKDLREHIENTGAIFIDFPNNT